MSSLTGVLISLFLVVLSSSALVGHVFLTRQAAKKGREDDPSPALDPVTETSEATKTVLARTLHTVGEVAGGKRFEDASLRKRLSMAGYRWPTAVTVFHGLRIAVSLGAAGIVGWTVLFMNGDLTGALVPSICAAAFGYMLPDRLLLARVRARSKRIRAGLPAAVDLLVLIMEAGKPLDQAMHDVSRALSRVYPELSEEFLFFHLEVQAGKPRYEALGHLADRSPEPELRKLVTVLMDGDRYGTSMGPALRTHARFLRTRMRQQAQETARKLTVKLTIPTFLLIFPAVLVVTLGPAYLQLKDSLAWLLSF